jgi:HAE1 family hydrophobic/amphiphilic exporter-1
LANGGQSADPESQPAGGGFVRLLSAPAVAFDRLWTRFAHAYERTLATALHHRTRVVIASVIALALTVPFALDLERSVLPEVDQNEFRVVVELPLGTTLEATAATAERLDNLIREDPAVNAVLSRIGRQVAIGGVDEDNTGVHTAVLDVKLNEGERASRAIERLQPKLAEFPSGSITLESGHATALGKLLGAGEADLAVRVRGEDLEGAIRYAQSIQSRLAQHPRLTNVRVGTELGQPEFEVEVDRERAAAYGIDANAVVTFIDQHMRGTEATQFVAFDRKIPIIVRLPEAQRRSLETLQTLQIRGVPISDLIHVREALGPVEVHRLDQNRIVPLYADVQNSGVDEAVAAVRTVVDANPPPEGLRVDVGGENEEMRRSFRDLALAFALAVLLVYMILAAEFESFLHPFTVLLSVPLGLIGAILALWVFGAGLNTVSLIGIVILVGIVDNDAVVKIDYINQLRREGRATRAAILEAGSARLRPIVMNSLTAMLGIAPMMLGIGTGAGLQAPLAIAIFGGLFTSTALTLIVIPVVYELIDDARVWLARRAGRSAAAPGTVPEFEQPGTRTPQPATGD